MWPNVPATSKNEQKAHIDQLLHKLSTVGFLMQKLSYVLSINNIKSVYYAYYHSLVKYGIIL
jgi:hypothetical protein